MTFRVSNGSRPHYSAMHDVMVALRFSTTVHYCSDGGIVRMFVLCGAKCTYVDRGDCDVWMPRPVGVSGVLVVLPWLCGGG